MRKIYIFYIIIGQDGDDMTAIKLKEIFEKQGEVRFKLYSLEYIIKKQIIKQLCIPYCMKVEKVFLIHLKKH